MEGEYKKGAEAGVALDSRSYAAGDRPQDSSAILYRSIALYAHVQVGTGTQYCTVLYTRSTIRYALSIVTQYYTVRTQYYTVRTQYCTVRSTVLYATLRSTVL
eukprot:Lankesteria_metandrocarpae@DN2766_c0_g1_i1.p2